MAAWHKWRPFIAEGRGIKNCSSVPHFLVPISLELDIVPMPPRVRAAALGFFEFVHNVRERGQALLHVLIELLVA